MSLDSIKVTYKNVEIDLSSDLSSNPSSDLSSNPSSVPSINSGSFTFKLNFNVLPLASLLICFDSKLINSHLSQIPISEITISEVENFHNFFKPNDVNSIINIHDNFIYIKYPGSTTYEKINWHRLKNMYKKHSTNIEIIKLLYAVSSLRKLTMIIIKEILFDNFVNPCYNEAGSTNLTSDLDFSYINISHPSLSVVSMDLFNKLIKSIYNDDPWNVFDINYYICSTFFSAECYDNPDNKKIELQKVNYGIDMKKIIRLYKLFNICTDDVFDEFLNIGKKNDLSDILLQKIYLCNSTKCEKSIDTELIIKTFDKFFIKKDVEINGVMKKIYYLDFPSIDSDVEYKNYPLMDLYFDISLLSNCINELIYNISKISKDPKYPVNKNKNIISNNNELRYKHNLIYSQAYYDILDSIKSNETRSCTNDIRFKSIIMLKCLMSLMSASANESYVSDVAVSLIVYKFKLDKFDPNINSKKFVAFMDNFRFILEWYLIFLEEEKVEKTIKKSDDIAKYKFFDSVCKYFVRILALDAYEYNKLISDIIDPKLLKEYNEFERANGKLITHVESVPNLASIGYSDFGDGRKTSLIKSKSALSIDSSLSSTSSIDISTKLNSRKTSTDKDTVITRTKSTKDLIFNDKERTRTISIVELPFNINTTITKVYDELKNKNLHMIIEIFITFYTTKISSLNSSVLETATSVFQKINSIFDIESE